MSLFHFSLLINFALRSITLSTSLVLVHAYSVMSLRSLFFCLLLLTFQPLYGPLGLVAATSATGKINLYDDWDCNDPSTLNPTVNLPLSTCLVTTGGGGLVIDQVPPCSQGTATMVYYSDTACGVQTTDVSTSILSDSCMQLAAGTDMYNAKSVMFSCQPAANHPQASSTSTAVVSALAAVATGSSASQTPVPFDGTTDGTTGQSGGSFGGSASSTTSAASSTPTGTDTQQNSTGSSTSITNNSNTSGSKPASGLDTGDIIALTVGLGVGVTAIAVALGAWLVPNFRHTLKRWFSCSGSRVHQHPSGWQEMDTQRPQPQHQQSSSGWQEGVGPLARFALGQLNNNANGSNGANGLNFS